MMTSETLLLMIGCSLIFSYLTVCLRSIDEADPVETEMSANQDSQETSRVTCTDSPTRHAQGR